MSVSMDGIISSARAFVRGNLLKHFCSIAGVSPNLDHLCEQDLKAVQQVAVEFLDGGKEGTNETKASWPTSLHYYWKSTRRGIQQVTSTLSFLVNIVIFSLDPKNSF